MIPQENGSKKRPAIKFLPARPKWILRDVLGSLSRGHPLKSLEEQFRKSSKADKHPAPYFIN